MKFAIAALLAATSGMKIDAEAHGMPGGMSTTTTTTTPMALRKKQDDNATSCLSRDETNKVFKDIDTKHNGYINFYGPLYTGTRKWLADQDQSKAKALDHKFKTALFYQFKGLQKGPFEWAYKVDEEAYYGVLNSLTEHFKLCPAKQKKAAPTTSTTTTTPMALRKNSAPTCMSRDETNKVFEHIDVKHNGYINWYGPLYYGTRKFLKDKSKVLNFDERTFKTQLLILFKGLQNGPNDWNYKVNEEAYYGVLNSITEYFKLCPAKQKKAAPTCISETLAKDQFKALDSNHNGSLSYDEIKAGIEAFAKSQNHTLTQDEWTWIKETGTKIDSKTPGKVDNFEFYEFTNAIAEHFGMCNKAQEEIEKEAAEAEFDNNFDNTGSKTTGGSTYITWVNKSNHYITTYWLSYGGPQWRYSVVAPGGSYKQQTYVGHKWFIRSGNSNAKGQILARVKGETGSMTYEVEGKATTKQCDKVYESSPPSVKDFTVGTDCVYKSRHNQKIEIFRTADQITGIKGPGTSNQLFHKVDKFSKSVPSQPNTWGLFQIIPPMNNFHYVTIVKEGDGYKWINAANFKWSLTATEGASQQMQELSNTCE